LYLPPITDPRITGRQYTVKRIDAGINPVSIRVAADTPERRTTEKIDGRTTIDLERQYSWVSLVADGTNWSIISQG
jgi:hypothetical protein